MTFLRSFLTGSLAIAGLAGTAWAKGDDVDFARSLVRDGFIDLATEYCDRLAKDPGTTPEDKAGLQLIQAEIYAKTATMQEDSAKAQEELDKAKKVLEDFIAGNGSHPRAPEAKFQIGMLLRQKGDFIVAQLKRESDSSKKADLIAEGDKNFKRAEEYFAGLKDEYKKMKDDWWQRTNGRNPTEAEKKEEEDILYNLMDAVYNEPRTLYSHCLLYDAGSKEKGELTGKAVALFMDFELEYGDRMKAYESSIFWALTHKERGEFDKAYPRFDFTISLQEYFTGGALPDDAREIILTAFYYKAMTQNEERKYKEAIDTIDAMIKLAKDAARDRIGIAACLLQGDAWVGLGEKEKAIELGTRLLKQVTSESAQAMIRKRIADWSTGGAGAGLAVYMIKYQAAMDEDKYVLAIAALQGAVAAAEASGQEKEVPEILWKMASVYADRMDRLYDAVIIYETIAVDYMKAEKAPQAAFQAARIWNRISAAIGMEKSFEKDQVQKNLQHLTKNWPGDPNAKNAQFLVAEGFAEKGDFEKAAEEFLKVSEDANLYEQAMVMGGKSYYDLARKAWGEGKKDQKTIDMFGKAEGQFKKYLEYIKKNKAKDEKIEAQRPVVEAFCKQSLANLFLHESRKKYDEALKVLEEIEAAAPPDEVKKKVWRQKVTAFLALNQTDKAIAVTENLLANFKSAPVTVEACQLVGSKCDEEAEKIVGENPTPEKITDEALRLWGLAAKYYSNWIHSAIEARQKVQIDVALGVADRIYNLGLLINKIDDKKSFTGMDLDSLKNPKIFQDASKIYEPIANEELGRPAGVDTSKLLLKLAWCKDFAQDWEGARDAYERLIQAERLRNADGKTINDSVLKAKPWLFVAYEELGHVYIRLGGLGVNKAGSLLEAYTIFANVVAKSEKDTEGWWRAKYLVIKILFERGQANDFEMAILGIKDMRSNYPRWDDDKFKMKSMWEDLEKAILERAPK
ncbi:MAG: tetratricopeptide repeat protein [Planctomycetes bacterium]|nr:tetratricopeptide repeat protein [Planctomycetota bacterium]